MRTFLLRLLLVCTLASAQFGGIVHSLSHFKNPSRGDLPAGTLHPHHCAVCDAYNLFDHGVSGTVALSLSPLSYAALLPVSDREFFVAEAAPFAIRAPPA
jgi:hypothetical protein